MMLEPQPTASGSGYRSRSTSGSKSRSTSRKRGHEVISVSSPSGAEGSDPEACVTVVKRNTTRRGRISAAKGRGSTMAEAKATLRALNMEAEEAEFERKLRAQAFKKTASKSRSAPGSEEDLSLEVLPTLDPAMLGAEELRAVAGRHAASIYEVTKKSQNLKGTMIKALREASNNLLEVVQVLANRAEPDEARRVRADNARLQREVDALKAVSEMPPLQGDALEELKRSLISSVGVMVSARFRNIEDRLLPEVNLRPPLAADKRRASTAAAEMAERPVVGAYRRSGAPIFECRSPSVVSRASPAPGAARDETWSTVVKRGKSKKSAPQKSVPVRNVPVERTTSETTRPKQRERKKKQLKLPSPRSPAVIISLQAEAAAKGVTYGQLLERAAERIDLAELGLEGGLKIRRSATGARLLELPKAAPEKADKLAACLRTTLSGLADIARPVKRVGLKIRGLDDSVTREKVLAAIRRVTKCSSEALHVGEIRWGYGQLGVTFARCPVDAAKILLDSSRLLVGWSSAHVELLEERPMRCFGCQEPGHTRAVCPSNIDRSMVCFRCGLVGHSRDDCTGVLRCAVCADLGLQAGHELGSRACKAPKKRGRAAGPSQAADRVRGAQAPVEAMSQ